MTLELELSPEAEARLRERAAEAGKELQAFVLEAVEEKLAADTPAPNARNIGDWLKALRAWGDSHPRREYLADDSRESIYAGSDE
ncbi:MAG: hypothetical protein WD468_13230 [Pirellulales bacterium]